MRLGACTWTFGNAPLLEVARRAQQLGLDGVELRGDLALPPAQTRRQLADHGLAVLSITPNDADIFHPDRTTRNAAVDHYCKLVDWAAELAAPVVGCHGTLGRVRAITSYEEEWDLCVQAVCRIADHAASTGPRIAMGLLNRYEAHLLNTVEQGLRFIEAVGKDNVGLLLDTYHMNIEESDLPAAVLGARDSLFLFHAADSNRLAIGRGHTDFPSVLRALGAIHYGGDMVFECVPEGPDPFTWDKGPNTVDRLDAHLEESVRLMRHYMEVTGGRPRGQQRN